VHGVTSSDRAGVSGTNTGAGAGVFGASSTGNAGEFHGNVLVKGNLTATDVILSGADCAEEFDTHQGSGIEPGSVVVFGDDGALITSDKPYDRRVAGVISGAGSFQPGVILDRQISDRGRVPLALVGKVYCKVDAAYAPIMVGDLLTTSATSGHAMKAVDPLRAFGAVIGKALAHHDDRKGLIPVLVTLQ
jgi:hypothetical protein